MKRIAVIAALACLVGCGGDRVAGGGGFGGETISGRVFDTTGRAVSGATIRARLSKSLDVASLQETTTDDSGRYTLSDLPAAALRIDVAGKSGTDSVKAVADHAPGDAVGDVVALAVPDRRIRIVDGGGSPVAAALQAYGLGIVASTDDSGFARLQGWPAADIWVKASPRDGGRPFDLLIPAKATGNLVASSGWLIDDFEGAQTRTRLGLLIGGGWWYAVAAGTGLDSSAANVAGSVFGSGYDTTQAREGRACLHVDFVFRSAGYNRYGLVGFHFGVVDGEPVDLSSMDSLVLWAKGNGPVRVELLALDSGVQRLYVKTIVPGGDWTRFALVPTDFVTTDGGDGWSAAAARTVRLQFSVFQDTDFRLDDIRLFAKRLP